MSLESMNSNNSDQNIPADVFRNLVDDFSLGKFEDVCKEISTLMAEFPKSSNLWNLLGATNFQLGKLQSALDCYEKSISLNPNYAEAYNNLGNTLRDQGKTEEAINSYKAALIIKADLYETLYNLGELFQEKGEFLKAIQNYKETLKINPRNPEVYNGMGNSYKSVGDLEEAILSYHKAISIKPDYTEAQSNLIDTLTFYKSHKPISNSIYDANMEIGKISFENNNELMSDKDIADLLGKATDIINRFKIKTNYPTTQTARRYSASLNCERHISIFNKHNIIPEFCFNCYKVQIAPKNVIDLIKLFFVFDSLKLKNNNIRKCMVELRQKVPGFYKGLIYCSSLKEANEIAKELDNSIKRTSDLKLYTEVKRGCTEYYLSFPEYKKINSLDGRPMSYNDSWRVIEKTFDRKTPKTRKKSLTIPGLSLSDCLIIQNWISYAKGIGDGTGDLIANKTLFSDYFYKLAKQRTNLHPFGAQ